MAGVVSFTEDIGGGNCNGAGGGADISENMGWIDGIINSNGGLNLVGGAVGGGSACNITIQNQSNDAIRISTVTSGVSQYKLTIAANSSGVVTRASGEAIVAFDASGATLLAVLLSNAADCGPLTYGSGGASAPTATPIPQPTATPMPPVDTDGDSISDDIDVDDDNDGILDTDEQGAAGSCVGAIIPGQNATWENINNVNGTVVGTGTITSVNANNISPTWSQASFGKLPAGTDGSLFFTQQTVTNGEARMGFNNDPAAGSDPADLAYGFRLLFNGNIVLIEAGATVAANGTPTTQGAGKVYELRRTGGTVAAYVDDILIHTFGNSNTGALSFNFYYYNGDIELVDITICASDSDGDGIPNALDLDSDNDGINDVDESGGTDADRDGFADGTPDANGAPVPAGNPVGSSQDGPATATGGDADEDGILDSADGDQANYGDGETVIPTPTATPLPQPTPVVSDATITIEFDEMTAAEGETVVVPITISPNDSNETIASLEMTVSYDESVAEATGCSFGDGFSGVCSVSTLGSVVISAINPNGQSNDMTPVEIIFSIVGSTGDSTALTGAVSVSGLGNSSGVILTDYVITNGQLTILGYTMGDVNCDDNSNTVDALFIMQHVVGMREDSGGCALADSTSQINVAGGDTNGDNNSDTIDALFIMQCVVGMDNVFCPQNGGVLGAAAKSAEPLSTYTVDANDHAQLYSFDQVGAATFDVVYDYTVASFSGCQASAEGASAVCHEASDGLVRVSYINPASSAGPLVMLEFDTTVGQVEVSVLNLVDGNGSRLLIEETSQQQRQLFLPMLLQ